MPSQTHPVTPGQNETEFRKAKKRNIVISISAMLKINLVDNLHARSDRG